MKAALRARRPVDFTAPDEKLWPTGRSSSPKVGRGKSQYYSNYSSTYTPTTTTPVVAPPTRPRPFRPSSRPRRRRRLRSRTRRRPHDAPPTDADTAADRPRRPPDRPGPDVSLDELEALLLVQEHDTALDQLRHRRAALPERAELEARGRGAARARGAGARGRRPARRGARRGAPPRRRGPLGRRQGRRGQQAAVLRARTTSPRELQAMQADIDMLQPPALRPRGRGARGHGSTRERSTPSSRRSTPTSAPHRRRDRRGCSGLIADAEAEIDAEIAERGRGAGARKRPRSRSRCSPTTSAGARRTRARARPGSSARRARRATSRSRRRRPSRSAARRAATIVVLRQLRRDPRSVTQASLPFAGRRPQGRRGRPLSATAGRAATPARRRSARWCSTPRPTRPRCSPR